MTKRPSSAAFDDRFTDMRIDIDQLKKDIERLDEIKLNKDDLEMLLEKNRRQ